jgi:hypothetical protein
LGRKSSPETKAKMSVSKMGHPTSEETKAKIKLALKGNPKLREAARRNKDKRIESLKLWNRYRDWESCSL